MRISPSALGRHLYRDGPHDKHNLTHSHAEQHSILRRMAFGFLPVNAIALCLPVRSFGLIVPKVERTGGLYMVVYESVSPVVPVTMDLEVTPSMFNR